MYLYMLKLDNELARTTKGVRPNSPKFCRSDTHWGYCCWKESQRGSKPLQQPQGLVLWRQHQLKQFLQVLSNSSNSCPLKEHQKLTTFFPFSTLLKPLDDSWCFFVLPCQQLVFPPFSFSESLPLNYSRLWNLAYFTTKRSQTNTLLKN